MDDKYQTRNSELDLSHTKTHALYFLLLSSKWSNLRKRYKDYKEFLYTLQSDSLVF